ncbi:DUF7848 domain-containing protein [Streptomyces sp. WZ-12]|uniref:DUF7848 domain-containing protein n=1 Tax=Streptomyces sp. WZ-12 TaxID=3030210 RepID=UPI00406D4335
MTGAGRVLQWTLQANSGPTYVGKCWDCTKFSLGTPSKDDARSWCLQHVGATGHTDFDVTAEESFVAVLAEHPAT